jgi:malonate decarboxylase alpha subunit
MSREIRAPQWRNQCSERQSRLEAEKKYANGKLVSAENTKALLKAVVRPRDRVCLEGDKHKQADFSGGGLGQHRQVARSDLHTVQCGIVLKTHSICLSVESHGDSISPTRDRKGDRSRAHSSPGQIELSALHTHIELFARYFMDLTPHGALIAVS